MLESLKYNAPLSALRHCPNSINPTRYIWWWWNRSISAFVPRNVWCAQLSIAYRRFTSPHTRLVYDVVAYSNFVAFLVRIACVRIVKLRCTRYMYTYRDNLGRCCKTTTIRREEGQGTTRTATLYSTGVTPLWIYLVALIVLRDGHMLLFMKQPPPSPPQALFETITINMKEYLCHNGI